MKLTVLIERHTAGQKKGMFSARVEQGSSRGIDLLASSHLSKLETAKARVAEKLRGHAIDFRIIDPDQH